MMDRHEIAYIAGLIDAMARIRVTKVTSGTSLPLVAISCPNLDLLTYLGEKTGITPFTTSREYDRHRCGLHCDEAHDHITSVSGRWSVNGTKATVLLHAIEPHARLQTEAIGETLKVGMNAPRKPATLAKMESLGWPLPPALAIRRIG